MLEQQVEQVHHTFGSSRDSESAINSRLGESTGRSTKELTRRPTKWKTKHSIGQVVRIEQYIGV